MSSPNSPGARASGAPWPQAAARQPCTGHRQVPGACRCRGIHHRALHPRTPAPKHRRALCRWPSCPRERAGPALSLVSSMQRCLLHAPMVAPNTRGSSRCSTPARPGRPRAAWAPPLRPSRSSGSRPAAVSRPRLPHIAAAANRSCLLGADRACRLPPAAALHRRPAARPCSIRRTQVDNQQRQRRPRCPRGGPTAGGQTAAPLSPSRQQQRRPAAAARAARPRHP